MLLIHNDHADVGKWGKKCRSCADGNGDIPTQYTIPLVIPFARGKTTVENGNTLSEPGPEPSLHLCNQRDFRNKDNDGMLAVYRGFGQTQIDLCFAASGHTSQQIGGKSSAQRG